MSKDCIYCGAEIGAGRLEVLPDTETCVSCSTEQKNVCVPAYAHKTGGSIVILDSRDKEGIRLARNQYRRTRWAG